MIICNRCAQSLPPEAFWADQYNRRTGRQRRCKDCAREFVRGWTAAKNARRFAADPEWSKKFNREKRAKDPRKYWLSVTAAAIKVRARKLGVPCTLTRVYLETITPDACPIFGIPFDFASKVSKKPEFNSPSVDRIVPDLGYVEGNLVVISYRANAIKRDASVAELVRLAEFYTALTGCSQTSQPGSVAAPPSLAA